LNGKDDEYNPDRNREDTRVLSLETPEINTMTENTNNPQSCHIFTFPFKWDFKPKGKSSEETDFSKRTSLKDFHDILLHPHSPWQENLFKITGSPDFNEYIYFYDFARDVIFPKEKESEIFRQYEYIITPGTQPVYKIKTIDSSEPYELNIEKILLTIYFTGVGILSFHLENHHHPEFKDILRINEFGRRLYPQFLADRADGCTKNVKSSFLADSLEVCIDSTKNFKEDFSHFDTIANVDRNPHVLSHTIMGLLGDSFYTVEPGKEEKGIVISPILDDRMFVLCQLADRTLCETLAKYDAKSETYGYVKNDDWFKLVFVDTKFPSCNSIPMKKKLLMEHTYDRWIGTKWSSLFGVTRYSFILSNDDPGTFVKGHFKTMYFRMVQLALVQRASILRFSAEATRIADMKDPGNTTEKVSELQKKYLQFINKIYFREVTAFEQGIDLYGKIIGVMKIERDIKQLDQEIEELRHYASLWEEKRHNRQLHLLTILGSLFLIPGFIVGFFGMNLFSGQLDVTAPGKLWVILGGIALVSFLTWLIITIRTQWQEKTGPLKTLVLTLLLAGVVYFLVILVSGVLFTLMGVQP
jgi:hypothetical protein